MKMLEILRTVADAIDSEASGKLSQQSVEIPAPAEQEQDPMVPPLQTKLEILKKSEGLPSVYDQDAEEDNGCGCEQCACSDADSELDSIRKLAGTSTVIKTEMIDDDPYEG